MSIDQAKKNLQRVGDKPLVIKASKAQGTDLVLSSDDVKKLSEANHSYLAEGRRTLEDVLPIRVREAAGSKK